MNLPSIQQMPGTPAWEREHAPESIVAIARLADKLGYAWLPCSDHAAIPARAEPTMGRTWYDPAATLAFVAGCTTRIRLLTHVVVLPYHDPIRIAKQYATLDQLSDGRVILGVGAGHLKAEFAALGANYNERGAITDESIEAIKELWQKESASFRGEHVSFRDLYVSPQPVQQPRPRIWAGGNGRVAIRRAATLCDGWVPFDVTPEDVREQLQGVRTLLEQRTSRFDVIVPAAPVALRDEALDEERQMFAGSPEQVCTDIRRYEEAGVTGMTVGFRSASLAEQMEKMERFAAEVFPAFEG